jgi:hypothetical protein
MLNGGAAYPCKNPDKENPDGFRSEIEKANKSNYVTKKQLTLSDRPFGRLLQNHSARESSS